MHSKIESVVMGVMLVNYKKLRSFPLFILNSLKAPIKEGTKKHFFKLEHWRFSKKAKCLIVFAIIAVMLISVFAFLPKQNTSKADVIPQNASTPTGSPSAAATQPPKKQSDTNLWLPIIHNPIAPPTQKSTGVIGSAQTINSAVWKQVAANAWNYFQPGVGVDANTGLPFAGTGGFPYFTDWDLGAYIQAVIDAQKIGLIDTGGSWGSHDRLDKVLTFLETRELNSTSGYPYWFYQASDGKDYHSISDGAAGPVDVADTGRLLVALNNLKTYNSNWTQRINNFVYNVNGDRSNYAALAPGVKAESATSISIYAYYTFSGFTSFWPSQTANASNTILNNILSSQNITTNNVTLPKALISSEPLYCSLFELNNNPKLTALAKQVYLAHEAYYNSTGEYVAFSEGNSPSGFVWEWVVLPNGDTWKVQDPGTLGSSSYTGMEPVFYTKVAFSFLALYNTTFAHDMVVSLEQNLPDPTAGYSDGADNLGDVVSQVGSNSNGLILDAALYAITNNP